MNIKMKEVQEGTETIVHDKGGNAIVGVAAVHDHSVMSFSSNDATLLPLFSNSKGPVELQTYQLFRILKRLRKEERNAPC